jgi:hypothetical protein
MPISVYGPDDGPDTVRLFAWSIRELPDGERRFCGNSGYEGRVSTPILEFDPVTRTGITTSGRHYVLVGRCGWDRDGDYVWGRAMAAWRIESWRDVTLDLVPDARKGLNLPLSSGSRHEAFPEPALTLDQFDQMLAELDEQDAKKNEPTE